MERDLLKSRLARFDPARQLPPPVPASWHGAGDADDDNALETLREGEALGDDEADEERDSFPSGPTELRKTPRRRVGGFASSSQQYTPLSAAGLFDEALEVQTTISQLYTDSPGEVEATFRVYYSPPEVGVNDGATVFVCVHGAGYSGLSFARFARSLVDSNRGPQDGDGGENIGKIGVLAYDARGHGRTRVPEPPNGSAARLDMSLGSLADDLVRLLKAVYPDRSEAPAIVLVGHSMGGAVVSEASNRIQQEVTTVTGVVVIDVVEGTALEALPGMSALVASHPKSFESQEDAIAWHVHSRTINNLDSARISVPPLLKRAEAGAKPSGAESDGDYVWRFELEKTEPFWSGWFTGLSKKFLACRTAKLLLLAGTDRLDKDLLIGQMQGRYQLEVYPDVGHCVHEDAPERTAETLLSFWERNDRSDVLKGVKKVGEP
ncbi:A/B superfamily hydrolase [Rhodotorula taiwanensis]|uniref:Protein phosphatase methylesterase 1 n=1 Tax=Rhodotorula taiwanensis TaxID=741276 RepID=A0A2S5AZI2_9BASI|nr:A/B superfamily hydrolase [Rhodotorula taiwanensis]